MSDFAHLICKNIYVRSDYDKCGLVKIIVIWVTEVSKSISACWLDGSQISKSRIFRKKNISHCENYSFILHMFFLVNNFAILALIEPIQLWCYTSLDILSILFVTNFH